MADEIAFLMLFQMLEAVCNSASSTWPKMVCIAASMFVMIVWMPCMIESMPACICEKSPVVMPTMRPNTTSNRPFIVSSTPLMMPRMFGMTDATTLNIWPSASTTTESTCATTGITSFTRKSTICSMYGMAASIASDMAA